MRRLLFPICLCLTLVAPDLSAQERKLEGWQKNILRALEEAEELEENDKRKPPSLRGSSQPDPGASAAAAKATKRYGGRALAVVRVGKGYRVRLLLDNGRVMTVVIPD